MNYNYLRYFSVLAEVEHYTTAAARLGISQPSLSSAIHNLENDLGGVALFEKVGRNVRLTEEGRYYRQKVDAALKELHAASITLRSSRQNAPVIIRLGVVSGTLYGIVADLLTEYAAKNRRVRFHLTESSAEELMDMVRKEKLDMAIVDSTDRDRSLHFRKLCEREFYVALPRFHPLANRIHLDPQDVVNLPQVVINYSVKNSFSQWASGMPQDESVICTVNTAQAALDLVSAGMGIAFVPKECVQKRSEIRYVSLNNWHQALYMCILYDKWLEPLIWEFGERVITTIRNMASGTEVV